MVLLNHFWPKSLSSRVWDLGQLAWIAMDSFFVLSGFLIAGILLDTRQRPDYYRSYYVRRALRVLPLYYCVLVYLICVSVFWKGGEHYRQLLQEWGSPVWFFAYLGNLAIAIAGTWPTVIRGLSPLWSLQIEEQFYLLFPFAIRRLSRERLARALWMLVLLSPALRVGSFFLAPGNLYLQYVLLPTHMEGLALGALMAIRFRSGPWALDKRRLSALAIVLLTATCVASAWSNPLRAEEEFASPFNRTVGFSLSSAACAALVLWLIRFRGSRWTEWLRWSPVQYVGRISYGIYLLHMPVREVVYVVLPSVGWSLPRESFAMVAVVIIASLACASLSWWLLERPLLSLKDRLAPAGPAES